MKSIIFILSIIIFSNSYGQSLVLRPGVGVRFFKTKIDNSLPNDLDETFSGNRRFSQVAFVIAAEILYNRQSFELSYTSQHLPSFASTTFSSVGISQQHVEDGGISQFQIAYNRFFRTEKFLSNKGVIPFSGIGIGLGINRPGSFYDSSGYHSRFYSTIYPSEYIDYTQTNKSISKIGMSLIFKIGISVQREKIERIRVYGIYNLGVNKLMESNYIYYHSQKKYFGSSSSKGNQFSLLLTAPIYIRRKK